MNFKLSKLSPFGVVVEPQTKPTHIREVDVQSIRSLYLENHIVLLRGFETFQSSDEFADYCENWGEISVWPFGKVLELIQHENPKDHIFDSSYVPMHWDGMYRPQVPEYQIFHCVKAPLAGHGGRTTFSNTVSVLKNIDEATLKLWSKVTGIYKRKMEFYNSKTVSPIVTKHPFRDYSVVRYNEVHTAANGNFVNPPDQEFIGIPEEELESFHQSIKEALYDPANFYAHEWEQGDVVITENFTLLHGRESFVSNSPRHIQRVQVLSNPPLANTGLESYI